MFLLEKQKVDEIMTVQYYESEMDEIEQKKGVPFVGYINPRGQLIDYSTLIGERTHYSTKNPASMMFLQFISYVMKGFSPEELNFFGIEMDISIKIIKQKVLMMLLKEVLIIIGNITIVVTKFFCKK